MEHEIVAGINKDTNDAERFREHFIDICGYRRTDASGGFDNVCKVLKDRTFGGTKSVCEFPVPAPSRDQPKGKSSREPPTPPISVLDCLQSEGVNSL